MPLLVPASLVEVELDPPPVPKPEPWLVLLEHEAIA
jgi:hypothetical protein